MAGTAGPSKAEQASILTMIDVCGHVYEDSTVLTRCNLAVATRLLSNTTSLLPTTLFPHEVTLKPVDIVNLHEIRRNPLKNRENLRVDNVTTCLNELQPFNDRTGSTLLLDLTPIKDQRNTAGLASIASSLPNVIVCYSASVMITDEDADDPAAAKEALKQLRIELLLGGSEGSSASTASKASAVVITIQRLFDTAHVSSILPRQSLAVVAQLHQSILADLAVDHPDMTTAEKTRRVPPIFIEVNPMHFSADILRGVLGMLKDKGAVMEKVVVLHVPASKGNYRDFIDLLDCYHCSLCFDAFGLFSTIMPDAAVHSLMPSDFEQVQIIADLIAAGYTKNIIISLAVQLKLQLKTFGGPGYEYLSAVIIPLLQSMLQDKTSSADQLKDICARNLSDLLTWREPLKQAVIPDVKIQCNICQKWFMPGKEDHYSKFSFNYCSRVCLQIHRSRDWK